MSEYTIPQNPTPAVDVMRERVLAAVLEAADSGVLISVAHRRNGDIEVELSARQTMTITRREPPAPADNEEDNDQ